MMGVYEGDNHRQPQERRLIIENIALDRIDRNRQVQWALGESDKRPLKFQPNKPIIEEHSYEDGADELYNRLMEQERKLSE